MSASAITPIDILLLVLVALLVLGAIAYLVVRHPRLAQPLGATGTWAAALVALVVAVISIR
ncbi:hypothetical protein [Streptomyces hydrogenans]